MSLVREARSVCETSRQAHSARSSFRLSCVPKTRGLTSNSEVSSRGNRRISAYVRVVVLGVVKRTVFWA